jgi:hypothetical protein
MLLLCAGTVNLIRLFHKNHKNHRLIVGILEAGDSIEQHATIQRCDIRSCRSTHHFQKRAKAFGCDAAEVSKAIVIIRSGWNQDLHSVDP